MTKEWEDMAMVNRQRNYFEQVRADIPFQCEHCKRHITLFGCTFTANRYDENGEGITGALHCSLCKKSAARAFLRLIRKRETQMWREAKENLASEEDDC